MNKTQIARVCHEANRAYCEALGDYSQVAWESAPQWQVDSAIKGVELHAANPDAGPEAGHNSWAAQKQIDGWVYGEVKDAEAKTHPCLVPFDQLPVAQRAKDFIFRGLVLALLPLDPDTVHGGDGENGVPVEPSAIAPGLPARFDIGDAVLYRDTLCHVVGVTFGADGRPAETAIRYHLTRDRDNGAGQVISDVSSLDVAATDARTTHPG